MENEFVMSPSQLRDCAWFCLWEPKYVATQTFFELNHEAFINAGRPEQVELDVMSPSQLRLEASLPARYSDFYKRRAGECAFARPEGRAELLAQVRAQAKPVRQFYYAVPTCGGFNYDDPRCTCWHDEGSPLFSRLLEVTRLGLTWRDKP